MRLIFSLTQNKRRWKRISDFLANFKGLRTDTGTDPCGYFSGAKLTHSRKSGGQDVCDCTAPSCMKRTDYSVFLYRP